MTDIAREAMRPKDEPSSCGIIVLMLIMAAVVLQMLWLYWLMVSG